MSRMVNFEKASFKVGASGYLIEGYTFRCEKKYPNRVSVHCTEANKATNCRARAMIPAGASMASLREGVYHNHPPPIKNAQTGFWQAAAPTKAIAKTKQQAKHEPSSSPKGKSGGTAATPFDRQHQTEAPFGGAWNPFAFMQQQNGKAATDPMQAMQTWLGAFSRPLGAPMVPPANQLGFPCAWPHLGTAVSQALNDQVVSSSAAKRKPVARALNVGTSKKSKINHEGTSSSSSRIVRTIGTTVLPVISNDLPSMGSNGGDKLASKAAIYLDVGGVQYTTTLETLTRYPNSIMAHLLNGTPPPVHTEPRRITVDRDGASFRFVLNFLRSGRLLLPEGFTEIELLEAEARFYELADLIEQIDDWRIFNAATKPQSEHRSALGRPPVLTKFNHGETLVVCVHKVHHEVLISGDRAIIGGVLPELKNALLLGTAGGDDGYVRGLSLTTHCPELGNGDEVLRRLIDGEEFVLESTSDIGESIEYVLV